MKQNKIKPKKKMITILNKMSNNNNNRLLLQQRQQPQATFSITKRSPSVHNNKHTTTPRIMREQSVMRILLNYRPTNSQSRLPSPLIPIQQKIMSMWSDKTNERRLYLQQQLNNYIENHPQHNFPMSTIACLMLHQMSQQFQKKNTNKKKVVANTLHTYAKELRTMLRRMGHETLVLDQIIKVYSIEANNDPLNQATPATRSQVEFLIRKAMEFKDVKLAVLIYVMWKTASRYDDVVNVTKDCVLTATTNQIVLKWGKLKTSKQNPHRIHNWIVIQEDNYPELLQLTTNVLQNPQNFPDSQIITPRRPRRNNNSNNNLLMMLQQENQSMEINNNNNSSNNPLSSITYNALIKFLHLFPETKELTAHSFKRGALGHLIRMAVQGHLDDPRLITVMAKHKDDLHDFPTTTVRYAPDPISFAKMIGTQKATKLL